MTLTEKQHIELSKLLQNKIPRRVIARKLYLSYDGLHSRIKSLYRYLGVNDLNHALSRAKKLGWFNNEGGEENSGISKR